MNNRAFESYCIFNCSGFNCRDKVHIAAESSASSFDLLWSRIDEKCGLMLVWGEIREVSTIHMTRSKLSS